jgi:hypothetical protein
MINIEVSILRELISKMFLSTSCSSCKTLLIIEALCCQFTHHYPSWVINLSRLQLHLSRFSLNAFLICYLLYFAAMKSSTCCSRNGNAAINHSPTSVTSNKTRNHNYDADHTVLSGVVIDWGHGWGWGQNAWAAHTACVTDAAVSSALYCHALGDYAVSGFDEVDCSAFGDFIF